MTESGPKDVVILFTGDVHSAVDSGWTYSGVDVIRRELIAKEITLFLRTPATPYKANRLPR